MVVGGFMEDLALLSSKHYKYHTLVAVALRGSVTVFKAMRKWDFLSSGDLHAIFLIPFFPIGIIKCGLLPCYLTLFSHCLGVFTHTRIFTDTSHTGKSLYVVYA